MIVRHNLTNDGPLPTAFVRAASPCRRGGFVDSKTCALIAAILAAVLVLADAVTAWPFGRGLWRYGSASTFLLYALSGLTVVLLLVLLDRLSRSRSRSRSRR